MKILFAIVLYYSSVTFAYSAEEAPPVAREKKTSPRLHRIDPQTPEGLQELFKYTGEALPFVSGHRGGSWTGYPENCLATFEHTLEHTYAILEIDPRMTKDGQIVVYHDPNLGRTSEGKGRVVDLTLAELQKLKLKDRDGNLTEYTMPTLDETLEWARGHTILVLDQKDVPVAERVKKITEHKAEGYAVVIVNSFKDAAACYAQNPKVMMEVMIGNRDKAAEFDKLGIPWRNVFAFVGHNPPEDEELYKLIHAKGACCMIGTSRNLDLKLLKKEVPELKPLEPEYRAFLKRGADLIETDIPVPLGTLLYSETRVPEGKKKFFETR